MDREVLRPDTAIDVIVGSTFMLMTRDRGQ